MSSSDKPYRCEQCGGMTFNSQEELQQHNRQEHGK
jgi:hypothetical protein